MADIDSASLKLSKVDELFVMFYCVKSIFAVVLILSSSHYFSCHYWTLVNVCLWLCCAAAASAAVFVLRSAYLQRFDAVDLECRIATVLRASKINTGSVNGASSSNS